MKRYKESIIGPTLEELESGIIKYKPAIILIHNLLDALVLYAAYPFGTKITIELLEEPYNRFKKEFASTSPTTNISDIIYGGFNISIIKKQ